MPNWVGRRPGGASKAGEGITAPEDSPAREVATSPRSWGAGRPTAALVASVAGGQDKMASFAQGMTGETIVEWRGALGGGGNEIQRGGEDAPWSRSPMWEQRNCTRRRRCSIAPEDVLPLTA